MTYVDCFVAPVSRARRAEYTEFSNRAGALYREHGALDLHEYWGEDVPSGVQTSFPLAVRAGTDEVVTLSLIVWPSRAARDAGNAAFMHDPRVQSLDLPFDGKRAIMGGFENLFGGAPR
jgi:uncharacterized protein YbaA (DUF1428 family)